MVIDGTKTEGEGSGEPRRFAVMLNANAKKVDTKVREGLAQLVPPDDLFFSTSMEEADEIVEEVVKRRYPVVFTGGGDGTVIDSIDRITKAADRLTDYPCPNIGILRLGTGNALAYIVSSGSFDSDIKQYVANGFRDIQKVALIESDGRRFPFGGMGWDAEILNDYRWVKERWGGKPVVGKFVQNLGAYWAAFLLRSAPRIGGRTIFRKKNTLRITNMGERALLLGSGGVARRVYGPGETIYEGQANIAMVGTTPFYGYGWRILPYAGLTTNFMHLRIGAFSMTDALRNFPPLWNGTFEHELLYDFYVEHVKLEFEHPMPYQVGGDAEGWRDSAEFSLSDASVNLVRFI